MNANELARAACAAFHETSFDTLPLDYRSYCVTHAQAILDGSAPTTPFDHHCVAILTAKPKVADEPSAAKVAAKLPALKNILKKGK